MENDTENSILNKLTLEELKLKVPELQTMKSKHGNVAWLSNKDLNSYNSLKILTDLYK